MLHPSLYFPDYGEAAKRPERAPDSPQTAVNTAPPDRPRRDFQRIVLPSGCVLFRLYPPCQ